MSLDQAPSSAARTVQITFDCRDPGALAEFWCSVLGHQIEAKSVKNRVHLDVRAAPGLQGDERLAAIEAEADRLVGLGGRRLVRVAPTTMDAGHLIVMADPEGNEFCLD